MYESQEIIKLISAANGTVCIVCGVIALFRGLKAGGVIDIKAAFINGKVKPGSAGIILLFCGIVLFALPIFKGKEEVQELRILRNAIIEYIVKEKTLIFRDREKN